MAGAHRYRPCVGRSYSPTSTGTAGRCWELGASAANRVARLSLACDCAQMSDAFNAVVSAAERDDRIVGLVLGGSRGKGLGSSRSDYDVYLVVADGTDPTAIVPSVDYSDRLDLIGVWTASAFADYAIGDGNDWNRYNFAHLQPPVDKLGSLQGLCDAKEWLPAGEARATAAGLLDAYLNYRFRAAKNHADGNLEAAALDAAESLLVMLDFIFTAERRARPYNKFLSWETCEASPREGLGDRDAPLHADTTGSHSGCRTASWLLPGGGGCGPPPRVRRDLERVAPFRAGADEVRKPLIAGDERQHTARPGNAHMCNSRAVHSARPITGISRALLTGSPA